MAFVPLMIESSVQIPIHSSDYLFLLYVVEYAYLYAYTQDEGQRSVLLGVIQSQHNHKPLVPSLSHSIEVHFHEENERQLTNQGKLFIEDGKDILMMERSQRIN